MNKQLLTDFVTTRPALREFLKKNTKHGKEQPITATEKTCQIVKTINAMKKRHQLMGKITSQHQNDRIQFTYNNINLKCKWPKCPNQKTQTGKLDKKSRPIGVLYSGNPSHVQGHTQSQNKVMEEDLSSKQSKKKAGVAILVSDKIDFKATKIKRDKEGHYIMVKGSMHQEELMILNIYAPNT